MTENQQPITLDDVVQAIENIGTGFDHHDKAIFEMVACVNALQDILIKKGIVTEEEMLEATKVQINDLREKVMNAIRKEAQEPTAA